MCESLNTAQYYAIMDMAQSSSHLKNTYSTEKMNFCSVLSSYFTSVLLSNCKVKNPGLH